MPDDHTIAEAHRMDECLGAQFGKSIFIYFDANRDGEVEPGEFFAMGPANKAIEFADVTADWDGARFVPRYTGGAPVELPDVSGELAQARSGLAATVKAVEAIEAKLTR